jgi:hypothetical protein
MECREDESTGCGLFGVVADEENPELEIWIV